MVDSPNNYIYSTNMGLYARNIKDIRNPEIFGWAEDYATPHKELLPYDDYFGPDIANYAVNISSKKPVTIVCFTPRDSKTGQGTIGFFNDSTGGTAVGTEFKSRLTKALLAKLEEKGIKAAFYDHGSDFILVMEGELDQKAISAIFEKAIGDVNPEFKTVLNGKRETVKFFEPAKGRPELKFGYLNVNEGSTAEQIKAVTDRLFENVKSKRYGYYDFNELLENVSKNEPYKLKKISVVEPDWKLVEENWNRYKFAFYDCNELMPDDFAANLKESANNYGIEIDNATKEYLIYKNRQLFVNEPTGALNKAAFSKLIGQVVTKKPENTWIAGGDIYNVTGLNRTLGRTVTDNYLRTFVETWKKTADLFGVRFDMFRIGGDEVAYLIRGADAETVARMNMVFHRLMNEKKVLPEELLSQLSDEEMKKNLKAGTVESGVDGKMVCTGKTWGDVDRPYEKISGVITKGSQQSFYAEKLSPMEKRLDPEHIKEWLMARATENAKKVYSETAVVLKQDSGYLVLDEKGMKYFQDYTVHKMNASDANLEAVKKIIIKDPKAQLISRNVSDNAVKEIYRLSDGKEIEIRTEVLKDRIEVMAGDQMMKLKKPGGIYSKDISRTLFSKPEDIYAYIDEMKKKGFSDAQILDDAIKRSEEMLDAKYLSQVKLLNKMGNVAKPLGVAAVLYGIYMIKKAPVEKRAEMFAGFASGFGTFAVGMKLGYRITKGNPLLRAGFGLILGSAFATIGDAGTRKIIGSIDKVKDVFEKSEISLSLMYALDIATDPMIYLEAAKEVVFGTEYKIKREYVAKYGPEGWDAKIDGQTAPLKEKLNAITARITDPDKTVNAYMQEHNISDITKIDNNDLQKYFKGLMKECSRLASKISELESKKYNIKMENYPSYNEYKEVIDTIQTEAKTGNPQPIKG